LFKSALKVVSPDSFLAFFTRSSFRITVVLICTSSIRQSYNNHTLASRYRVLKDKGVIVAREPWAWGLGERIKAKGEESWA
jgi:hypothetical protein